MPSGRDSFRRNRVAPSGYSLAFLGASGFGWLVVVVLRDRSLQLTATAALPLAKSSITAMDGRFLHLFAAGSTPWATR